ncbi:hypothetical protein BN85308920 [Paracholeplasma brassicae]|uniref:Major membrane immunogen, membrane-anchored lipoprotein n=1 Tax=Acholeplasma brassicae TaxID=61635 RepID=U4KRP3_9MOLU|nr:hypothetical protein [Paracholeplasma brassicae]CCV65913.1 hypothetical protein BN85308920 [Paracholeplasma brassicae]
MKRISLLLLLVVATFGLASCKKDEPKEFAVDGQFTAYEAQVHSNGAQQVTYVTVTIKDGKIDGYNIDVRQAKKTSTVEGEGDAAVTKYTYTWNEKTKKQLGDEYGMATKEGQLEWFEQAAKIEAYLLKNGVDSLDGVATGSAFDPSVDGMAGVTMKNAYTAIAKEAVALAKEGKFQAIYCSGTDLYSASMKVDSKGKVSELVLDTLQMNKTEAAKGTFAWNAKTKQQLKEEYGMKNVGPGYKLVDGTWVVDGKSQTEWYEQANLITKYVMEKGWSSAIKSIKGQGLSIDGTTIVDGYAAVTVKTDTYYTVLADLFAKAGK